MGKATNSRNLLFTCDSGQHCLIKCPSNFECSEYVKMLRLTENDRQHSVGTLRAGVFERDWREGPPDMVEVGRGSNKHQPPVPSGHHR